VKPRGGYEAEPAGLLIARFRASIARSGDGAVRGPSTTASSWSSIPASAARRRPHVAVAEVA
jgi:hypothetical protein